MISLKETLRTILNKLNIIEEKVPFTLGIDGDGNYGYIKEGADTVTPFLNFKDFQILTYQDGVTSNGAHTMTFTNASLLGANNVIILATLSSVNGSTNNQTACTLSTVTGGTFTRLTPNYYGGVVGLLTDIGTNDVTVTYAWASSSVHERASVFLIGCPY